VAQQLKRWESPRREGRNSKGKGGSARQLQLRKQFKTLSQKLKQGDRANNQDNSRADSRYSKKGREHQFSPLVVLGHGFRGYRAELG